MHTGINQVRSPIAQPKTISPTAKATHSRSPQQRRHQNVIQGQHQQRSSNHYHNNTKPNHPLQPTTITRKPTSVTKIPRTTKTQLQNYSRSPQHYHQTNHQENRRLETECPNKAVSHACRIHACNYRVGIRSSRQLSKLLRSTNCHTTSSRRIPSLVIFGAYTIHRGTSGHLCNGLKRLQPLGATGPSLRVTIKNYLTRGSQFAVISHTP